MTFCFILYSIFLVNLCFLLWKGRAKKSFIYKQFQKAIEIYLHNKIYHIEKWFYYSTYFSFYNLHRWFLRFFSYFDCNVSYSTFIAFQIYSLLEFYFISSYTSLLMKETHIYCINIYVGSLHSSGIFEICNKIKSVQ